MSPHYSKQFLSRHFCLSLGEAHWEVLRSVGGYADEVGDHGINPRLQFATESSQGCIASVVVYDGDQARSR
jgi:hypothetical protein